MRCVVSLAVVAHTIKFVFAEAKRKWYVDTLWIKCHTAATSNISHLCAQQVNNESTVCTHINEQYNCFPHFSWIFVVSVVLLLKDITTWDLFITSFLIWHFHSSFMCRQCTRTRLKTTFKGYCPVQDEIFIEFVLKLTRVNDNRMQ